MSQKRKKIRIGDHGAVIAALTGGVAAIAGIAISVKAGLPVSKMIDGQKIADAATKVAKVGSEVAKEAVKAGNEVAKDAAEATSSSGRYVVQMKALKTGEWYTKTVTDHIGPAYSVATTCAGPRASRVIDTLENVVKNVNPGDAASYAKYIK